MYRFVRKVLSKVFPPLLWGSRENEKTIQAAIFNFLSLGRYERITSQNIMMKIKTKHFISFQQRIERTPSHVQFFQKQRKSVETLIQWTFNKFIVPLVKGCFYVTESGVHKNKVLYYRKPMWRLIRCIGLQPSLGSLFNCV